jgi:hypothetical protein
VSRKFEVPQLSPLALDVACGFFSDSEIARRHGMTKYQFDQRMKSAVLRREVEDIKRQMNDDGAEIRLVARQWAAEAIATLGKIMTDEEVPTTTREKAATRILFFAGATPAASAKTPGDSQPILVINTNLRLGADEKEVPGTYSVRAIEHDPAGDLL